MKMDFPDAIRAATKLTRAQKLMGATRIIQSALLLGRGPTEPDHEQAVEVRAIDSATDFHDFDDYWSPFLGGQGPAPSYTMSLSEEQRVALRERLRQSLPFALDGSIPLVARAWAVRGVR